MPEKECAHEQVGLRTAHGQWFCAQCGEPIERRFAHVAATLATTPEPDRSINS